LRNEKESVVSRASRSEMREAKVIQGKDPAVAYLGNEKVSQRGE